MKCSDLYAMNLHVSIRNLMIQELKIRPLVLGQSWLNSCVIKTAFSCPVSQVVIYELVVGELVVENMPVGFQAHTWGDEASQGAGKIIIA